MGEIPTLLCPASCLLPGMKGRGDPRNAVFSTLPSPCLPASLLCLHAPDSIPPLVQVDDSILAQSRAEGTRDGSTALVVVRLGASLYSAHAGEEQAGRSWRELHGHSPLGCRGGGIYVPS